VSEKNTGPAFMDRLDVFLLALVAIVVIRAILHFVDKSHIREDVEAKGGRILSIRWNPFGRGWFFEKNERHYAVTYIDRSGATISAACKTSLFTGILGRRARSLKSLGPNSSRAIAARSVVTRLTPTGAPVPIAVTRRNSREHRQNLNSDPFALE
jgi:hypothetical protein